MRLSPLAFVFALSGILCAETESELQQRINVAIEAGGGEVVIPAETCLIQRGLVLKDARHLRIIGADREKSVLQLGPLVFAEVSAAAEAGASEIEVTRAQNLTAGMHLKIEADGEPDAFTNKPKPFQNATLESAGESRLKLTAPLRFPVPAGTTIRHEDGSNLIEIRGASEDIHIENLTIEGGRVDNGPAVRGHAQLCGIFAAGPYAYEKGPTGPRVKDLVISRCTIRNCYGRGIALYSVETSRIENCAISRTNDEAIDLDHFASKVIVRGNRVEASHVGVELNDASDCEVEGNDFRRCGIGLNLWRWCKQPGLNERNRISANSFSDTEGNALQIMAGTADNLVTGNRITTAGRNGITLAGAHQTVTGNRITGVQLKAILVNEGEHVIRDND